MGVRGGVATDLPRTASRIFQHSKDCSRSTMNGKLSGVMDSHPLYGVQSESSKSTVENYRTVYCLGLRNFQSPSLRGPPIGGSEGELPRISPPPPASFDVPSIVIVETSDRQCECNRLKIVGTENTSLAKDPEAALVEGAFPSKGGSR